MGAYSPVPWFDRAEELVASIHQPVVDELARRGSPFIGVLFAGLMITATARTCSSSTPLRRPRDPGADAAARRRPVAAALRMRRRRPLRLVARRLGDDAAVTIVLAAPDYPARSDFAARRDLGDRRRRGARARSSSMAGTAVRDGTVVTNGGRILYVTAIGPTVERGARPRVRGRRPDLLRRRADTGATSPDV